MARIIAVGNLKGGVGKSTLAVNLACQLATGCTVRLVDADAQAPVEARSALARDYPVTSVRLAALVAARDAQRPVGTF